MQHRRSGIGFLVAAFLAAVVFHWSSQAMAQETKFKCHCKFPTLTKPQIDGKDKPDRVDAKGNVFSYTCFAAYAGRCECDDDNRCQRVEYLAPCECGKPFEMLSVSRCDPVNKRRCSLSGDCLPWRETVKLECKEYEVSKISKDERCEDFGNQCFDGICAYHIKGSVDGKEITPSDPWRVLGRCSGDEEISASPATSFMEEYLQQYIHEVDGRKDQSSAVNANSKNEPNYVAADIKVIPGQSVGSEE